MVRGDGMEILKQVKDSIRFMEEHLYENISYIDVAESVYMSTYHFHKTFKVFTGITPSEYIKNRRLSNAGNDLMTSDISILDLAMKYQYDSLEGFSKAFSRFHGVTPSVARSNGVLLKMYHPLKINISFEGGKSMDYKIVTLEPFTLIGETRSFQIGVDDNKIPEFWNEKREAGLFDTLATYNKNNGVYGICHQIDSKSNEFSYGIAVKTEQDVTSNELEVIHIENPLWVVFECKDADHIGEVWDVVLTEFFVGSEYERVDTLDFEYYSDDRNDIFCELYIPVKKKIG